MKLKIKIISTLLSLTAIFLLTIIYFNTTKNHNIEKLIKSITQNTQIIDANTDHNQALDVIEFAQKQGIKPPEIIINFDTHSDAYFNSKTLSKSGSRIENWVNEYLAKYDNVDTFYWVMPKEEALNYRLRTDFGDNKKEEYAWGAPLYGNELQPNNNRFIFIPLSIKNYTQNALIDPKTGMMNEYVENLKINELLFEKDVKYKKIKIITCTENTLPDFKGKDVFLSIDADYISNSGFDTIDDFKNDRDEAGIEKAFISMMKTIDKKHIKPVIISMSLSPEYVPKEDHQILLKFFKKVIEISEKPDALQHYTRYNTNNGTGKSIRKFQD